jgi:hypothetical protein
MTKDAQIWSYILADWKRETDPKKIDDPDFEEPDLACIDPPENEGGE